jgi:hypothetical protein
LSWKGDPLAKEASQQFYQAFLSNGRHRSQATQRASPIDVRLHVHCGELPNLTPDALIFDAVANHWRLFCAGGHDVFEIFDTMPPHPTVQLAVMRPDFKSGDFYLRPEATTPRGSWSLTRLLRPFGELLLINLLAQGRGVLLHALGVADQGAGLLFIGRSGAGKSTLANLYKPRQSNGGVTILGDERVVVTKEDGQFWLSGTPWPGEGFTVSADTVPLRKVFFLEHGTQNVLISDSLINLHGLFFQQLFLPFWKREALAFALRFGDELLSTVPAARLAFVNDARVIEFLRSQVMSDG